MKGASVPFGQTLALVFLQMLPATLVAPAIRPLFALQHAGNESAMHAFMSVNMLAAAIAAPLLTWRLMRLPAVAAHRLSGPGWVVALMMTDALLLELCAWPLPTTWVLAARAFEGAAHVTVASVLLSQAASALRAAGQPRKMGAVGGAIIFAIASGNLLGAGLVSVSPLWAFHAAALVAVVSALLFAWKGRKEWAPSVPQVARARVELQLSMTLLAAFFARFTIGCLVVSFALFAHRAHGLSDGLVGLLFATLTMTFALATWPLSQLSRNGNGEALLWGGAIGWMVILATLGFVPTALLPVWMLLGGLCCAALFAATLQQATAPAEPEARARSIAAFNAAGALGMVLGPPAAGIVAVLAGGGARGDRADFLLGALAMSAWLALVALRRGARGLHAASAEFTARAKQGR